MLLAGPRRVNIIQAYVSSQYLTRETRERRRGDDARAPAGCVVSWRYAFKLRPGPAARLDARRGHRIAGELPESTASGTVSSIVAGELPGSTDRVW